MSDRINFFCKASVSFFCIMFVVSPVFASQAAGNGMIRGFRYTDCRLEKCLVVKAPQAWISSAGGGFIAESGTSQMAQVEIVKSGKTVFSKVANEAVLRPEVDLLSLENENEVVLIELSTLGVQVVRK